MTIAVGWDITQYNKEETGIMHFKAVHSFSYTGYVIYLDGFTLTMMFDQNHLQM